MIVRRFLLVVIGAVVGTVAAVIAWATIHPAPRGYTGSYVPLQSGQAAAYSSKLTITSDPATHPS